MALLETIQQVFVDSLGLDSAVFSIDLEYDTIPEWDSTGHMTLIAALEERFDIMLDMDDIIDMNSVSSCLDILGKYDIKDAS